MRAARKRDRAIIGRGKDWQPRAVGSASSDVSVSEVARRVKLGRGRRLQQDQQKVDVRVKFAGNVDPAYAIAKVIGDALDPVKAPGKVRTTAEMSPDEIAALVPPRKKV